MTRAETESPIHGGLGIKAWRINNGLSPAQLAEQMEIATKTLNAAESNQRIHPGTRKTIADFFDGLDEFENIEITVTSIWPELLEEAATTR